MSRIKTSRGVEIRSTVGMKSTKRANTWLIFMNRAEAKLFKWGRGTQELESVKSWKFPEGKKKGSDLISDQPGRVFDSRTFARGGHQTAGPRHSYGNKIKPQLHVAEKSVKNVCDWIDKNQDKDRITELVCVAEPRLMGMMQRHLKKRNKNPILRKWEKDLGWLDETQLRERLLTWLAGKRTVKSRFVPRPAGTHGIPNEGGTHGP